MIPAALPSPRQLQLLGQLVLEVAASLVLALQKRHRRRVQVREELVLLAPPAGDGGEREGLRDVPRQLAGEPRRAEVVRRERYVLRRLELAARLLLAARLPEAGVAREDARESETGPRDHALAGQRLAPVDAGT